MKPKIILSLKADNAGDALRQAEEFAAARSADVSAAPSGKARAKAARSLAWWRHRIEEINRNWFDLAAHIARRAEVFAAIDRNAAERARRASADRAERRRLKLCAHAEDSVEIRTTDMRAPIQNDKDDLVVQVQKVMKNIRHDVLEYEFACKRIDEAQKIAGDKLAALIARAGIGGAKAIDYENPKVDGGGKSDTLTDAVADAHKRLKHIREGIGPKRYALLTLAIGSGKNFEEIAGSWEVGGQYRPDRRSMRAYIAIEFRAALDDLVGVFGIARGKTGQDVRTWAAGHVPLHQCGGI
jgi:hypothetical protein